MNQRSTADLGVPETPLAPPLGVSSFEGAHRHDGADTRARAAGSGGVRRAASPGRRRAARSGRRRLVVVAAELLITGGMLVLLYVAWYVVVDNALLAHQQTSAADSLERTFEAQHPPVRGGAVVATEPTPAPGTAFAVMRIPQFGASWRRPLVQGTDLTDLSQGVGHYRGTAMPGQVGNFAVAGHRLTHGSAFTLIDHLRRGDPIIVHTALAWYVYRVASSEIVAPDQMDVIAPVPHHAGQVPTRRLMTLTSCNPLYGHTQRYIVYADLADVRPDTAGPPGLATTDGS